MDRVKSKKSIGCAPVFKFAIREFIPPVPDVTLITEGAKYRYRQWGVATREFHFR